ncbi:alpha/beta hydrolase [Marisediminicola sp. LYQ85]|uniref:alpha/beta hydrolase n=1 Tax=Marisediminicola sp. LYQ85 TaxID=3391062 RepID=UPI0039839A7D
MERRSGARRGRAVAVLATVLAAAVALTGCVSAFIPERSATSTPTGETVSAQLEPFYGQVLEWSACEGGFQCATAIAPLDWSEPSLGEIDLALIRSTAPSDPIGSLLINPGGPGGSGFDFVRDSVDFAASPRLQERYDIVGFDPRGVNRSSAVSCYDDPAELDAYLFDLPSAEPGTPEFIAESERVTAAFGAACLEHTGDLLGHVDTVSAAKDLDMLRAALGDARLNYLGYSYGTLLGATFADLFPGKTGRLVFDGAIDPATTDFDVTRTQAEGFESALEAYLEDCLTTSACPFRGSVDDAAGDIAALLDSLDASPLRATDGRQLGSRTMFYAIILPLYSAESWPVLTEMFASVLQGEADYAFQLADSYYARDADGVYADNSTEAFIAINCLDYTSSGTPESREEEAEQLAEVAPVFGPTMSGGGTSCAEWPFESTRERTEIAAEGSAPILVVGTTNDPATPYIWAQSLSEQLENGHLVTYDGEGHTAYNKSNACVDDAVDDFFLEGTVPRTDPLC